MAVGIRGRDIVGGSTYGATALRWGRMETLDMANIEQRPEYDGRTVYCTDVSKLRPGDILLTRSAVGDDKKGLAQANVIRVASNGSFDHALICTEPPTFVEALGGGVKTLSLQTCFAHDLSHVRLLRYPDIEVAKRAATFAQLQVGRDYSTKKAMASVFPSTLVDEIADRGIFCSALVAQAFADAGAVLFKRDRIGKTTPATIEKMSGLQDVTVEVFRPVLAPPTVETMVPLDAGRPISKSVAQTEITGRYAKILMPLADALIADFPDAELLTPNTFYECLQLLMRAIEATSKIPEERRVGYVDAVSTLDERAAALMETGELKAVFEALNEIDTAEIQRNIEASFQPRPNIDITAMRGLLEATHGQIASRSQAVADFTAWTRSSNAMAAWVELQEIPISVFRLRAAAIKEILARIGDH